MIFADGDLQLYDDGSSSDALAAAGHPSLNAGSPETLSTHGVSDNTSATDAQHTYPVIFPVLNVFGQLSRTPKPLARNSCAMQKVFSIMQDVLIEDGGEYGKLLHV